MPGHKGPAVAALNGLFDFDITEIEGADNLYHPTGIIKESEENASSLFGCPTYYSTEGSSQCIKAMLYMAVVNNGNKCRRILAGRNSHKAFVHAAALLDLDVNWLWPEKDTNSICSCPITADLLEKHLSENEYAAVYVTSPDYLGGVLDIRSLAKVAKAHGVPLLADCAHGAYFSFLDHDIYPALDNPVKLGAAMCCTSAHKTLPALTGGAYLHMSKEWAEMSDPKRAMEIFGSSSPSYPIMCSLDSVNKRLSEGYKEELRAYCKETEKLKQKLTDMGYMLLSAEPLKITIKAPLGTTGTKLSDLFRKNKMECEFADDEHLVMMLTPNNGSAVFKQIEDALTGIDPKYDTSTEQKNIIRPKRRMSIRQALMSPTKTVNVKDAIGKICASHAVSCPPAIPLIMPGEEIYEGFEYNGEIEIVNEDQTGTI